MFNDNISTITDKSTDKNKTPATSTTGMLPVTSNSADLTKPTIQYDHFGQPISNTPNYSIH